MQNAACSTFLLLSILFCLGANAQFSDDFSDGDFTTNPTWPGSNDSWIVNDAKQLQSNNTIANSSFYISTSNARVASTQWEMYVQLAFNPSSTNYIDVFLTASSSDLLSNSTVGYFVRLGNTADEVSLYRKNAGGGIIKMIDGRDGILNKSNNTVKIKISCSAAGVWTLQTDVTGTGTAFITEGTTADVTYTSSAYFGFAIKQSTASFFKKHFIDDIEIKEYVPDVTPPAIQSATVVSATALDIMFSEAVDAASVNNVNNYAVDNGIGKPSAVNVDAINPALVHLTFTNGFAIGVINTITVNSVEDLAGNILTNATTTFIYYIPQPFDVVIDEIFADPTPVVGLPEAEFVEIKNTSGKDINLEGWRLKSTSSISGDFSSYLLPADSFLVITRSSNAALFAPYGRTIGVTSFPSLENTGTTLSLVSKEGKTIHTVAYSDNWYQNEVKRNGGWTLEMIDPANPCTGSNNWKASTNSKGGTPGAKNSVNAKNADEMAPALLRAAALDSVTIVLTFSETIDSAKASNAANYSISDGPNTPLSAAAISPLFDKVILKLPTALAIGRVYTVTANNITDCSGNVIHAIKTARVGVASAIDSFDVVVNEILFNPKAGGEDYVEIYNRSSNAVDLKDLYIANRSTTTNALGSLRQLSTDNLQMFPGDFFVLSPDGALIQQSYVAKNPDHFIDLTLPSFPDDEGTVVLLNTQGVIVDELHYSAKWHFELLDNEEGISLERVDYNKPTQDKNNWHSAASTVGFGTPTYQNSQFRTDVSGSGEFVVTPKTFSPDNDGFEDFTTLTYQVTEPGFLANITIFDATGKPVKALAKNATLALKGSFRWDGLNDKLIKVPVGVYIIYTEIFNLSGKKRSFKNTVVVAAKF